MRLSITCAGLLFVVLAPIIGCGTATYVADSRQVSMAVAIKSGYARQTQRKDEEGFISASARKSHALVEFVPRQDLYRTRLALSLEPGNSEGEAVCELEETYRLKDEGGYAIRMEGVAESGPVPVGTGKSALEISIEVRSITDNSVVGGMHKVIRPRIFASEGLQRFWLSTAEEFDPLVVNIEAGVKYIVNTRLVLSASRESQISNMPMSINGEFRLIVEPVSWVKSREERAKSLAIELIKIWAGEDAKLAEDSQLREAANSLSRLFLDEAVRYVDIHIPDYHRFACFEQARIVREWYEARMKLDPNLAKWFRMTTVRRNTLFLWQSSNLITPNVSDPPDKWLDDGTGIVLETKIDAIGDFYGRYLTAQEFCLMGKRPKLQQTAGTSLISSQ